DTDALWGGLYTCTWDVTDVNGQASITLGDEKNYYIRVDGFRAYPAFGTISIITNSIAGQTYDWDCVIPSALPQHNLSTAIEYPNPLNHFRLEVEYDVEYCAAYQLFHSGSQFSLKQETACIDLFVADEANYASYIANEPAEAFGITDNADSGIIDFLLPTNDPWYAVFSAREFDVNCQRMNLTINVYLNVTGMEDTEDVSLPLTFKLDTPYPNPFNSETVIGFSLPAEDKISLTIYDLTGKRVAALVNQVYPAGRHKVRWTETTTLAAGVYFVELSGRAHTSIQKVCYLK
ncbi:T9SS type A sorting domain-containing protein, partial [bacterium]|nr:T9SS type A sorting domain-containing protein [bacterium]